MNDLRQVTKEKLIADFRVVVADAEELLRATAGQTGDKVAELRAKAQDNLAAARIKLAEYEAALVVKAKAVGRAADDYAHENHWPVVGIAAGVGFLVGLLMGRR